MVRFFAYALATSMMLQGCSGERPTKISFEKVAPPKVDYKGEKVSDLDSKVKLPAKIPVKVEETTIPAIPAPVVPVVPVKPEPSKITIAPEDNRYLENLQLIQADILKLDASKQQKQRYFSLHVASNAGASAANLDTHRKAFKKVINSLSTNAKLILPVAIDENKLIYRIDLDDMSISGTEFDAIMKQHYPFHATFASIGSSDSIIQEQVDETLKKILKSNFYLIRMDWFNATAPLPILYAKFLRFPEDLSAFEQKFLGERVDIATLSPEDRAKITFFRKENGKETIDRRSLNILQDQVLRIGFDTSFVSFSNRIVERHSTSVGNYWISYDFLTLKLGDSFFDASKGVQKNASIEDINEHNINKSPLGPKKHNGGSAEFNHDGGEVIFTLPNGLFGYYLVNSKGTLLDKGPIAVVRQANGPAEFGAAITNGMSCMSCHASGLLKQNDTIKDSLLKNKANFSQQDLEKINKIYNAEEFNRVLDEENVRYAAALNTLGITTSEPDPVDAAYRLYTKALNKTAVKAELEMSEDEMDSLLVDPDFSGIFNSLNNANGIMNRAVFQGIASSVVKKFKQEWNLGIPTAGDFIVTPSCMDLDPVQMDKCTITVVNPKPTP